MEHTETSEYRTIRISWNKQNKKWYFVVNDIVEAISKSCNPYRYIKEVRRENKEFATLWFQIATPLQVNTNWGRVNMKCADALGILEIIKFIPSPNAKPIKQWIVKAGLDTSKKIKNIASYSKRTDKFKKLLADPDAWIDKKNRIIFQCEDLYLKGELNDLELILGMLWDHSLMESFKTFEANKIAKSNYLLYPERKKRFIV
jgi:hypothetical protein